MKKIYLIKSLAPWMVDEMLEFSRHTDFEILFLRKQSNFYIDNIKRFEERNLKVNYLTMEIKNLSLRKIYFVIKFIIKNFSHFIRNKYSAIIGLNALVWFLFIDDELFIDDKISIHAQFATQAAIVSLLIKEFYGEKVEFSFTFHAYDIYFKNTWFEDLTKNCYKFYSISEFNIQYVKNKYIKSDFSKLELMRLGTNKIETNDNEVRINQILTLGLLSWFTKQKGIDYLLTALKQLKQEGIDVKLKLAGDGPLKQQILDIIKEFKIEDHVDYIGAINKEQKKDFFNSIDFFILPSISVPNLMDGIPVVLMEAIAYGKPIISTNLSGIPEICINNVNGFLIEEKSVSEIELSIKKIIKQPELLNEFKLGTKNIFEYYNIELNSYNKIKSLNWI